jgi:hypothetical protein
MNAPLSLNTSIAVALTLSAVNLSGKTSSYLMVLFERLVRTLSCTTLGLWTGDFRARWIGVLEW